MKKITILFLAGLIMIINSCSKSSTSPSIVGKWKFVNISGQKSSQPANGTTTTITWTTTAGVTLHVTKDDGLTSGSQKKSWTVNTENWNFTDIGTFILEENYAVDNSTEKSAATYTGQWEYLSSNVANNGIITSVVSNDFLPSNAINSYRIQKIDGSNLILTLYNGYTDPSGTIIIENYTLSFTKM